MHCDWRPLKTAATQFRKDYQSLGPSGIDPGAISLAKNNSHMTCLRRQRNTVWVIKVHNHLTWVGLIQSRDKKKKREKKLRAETKTYLKTKLTSSFDLCLQIPTCPCLLRVLQISDKPEQTHRSVSGEISCNPSLLVVLLYIES